MGQSVRILLALLLSTTAAKAETPKALNCDVWPSLIQQGEHGTTHLVEIHRNFENVDTPSFRVEFPKNNVPTRTAVDLNDNLQLVFFINSTPEDEQQGFTVRVYVSDSRLTSSLSPDINSQVVAFNETRNNLIGIRNLRNGANAAGDEGITISIENQTVINVLRDAELTVKAQEFTTDADRRLQTDHIYSEMSKKAFMMGLLKDGDFGDARLTCSLEE